MTKLSFGYHFLLFIALPFFLRSQNEGIASSYEKRAYLAGQFSIGYGFYLNGGDLISPGFEFKAGKSIRNNLSLGGGVAYTQFKPLDGLYGISLLSELRYFVRDESKNWRFSGVADLGVGIGGSRLQSGWATYNPGHRVYAGLAVYRKMDANTRIMLELGYLYQYLSYQDNTPGRGWQIFQTESILKYHFRRIQLKTGIFF